MYLEKALEALNKSETKRAKTLLLKAISFENISNGEWHWCQADKIEILTATQVGNKIHVTASYKGRESESFVISL